MRVTLILLTVLLMGCATKKNKGIDSPIQTKKVDLSYIFLARGGCYGTCPIFDVTITSDGKITYIGKNFVDHVGTFEGELIDKDLDALFEMAEQLDWSSYPDKFPIDNVDLPQFRITVGNTEFVKKIKANSRADQELIDLAAWIEARVNETSLKAVEE